jgi:hypothetical protein
MMPLTDFRGLRVRPQPLMTKRLLDQEPRI